MNPIHSWNDEDYQDLQDSENPDWMDDPQDYK